MDDDRAWEDKGWETPHEEGDDESKEVQEPDDTEGDEDESSWDDDQPSEPSQEHAEPEHSWDNRPEREPSNQQAKDAGGGADDQADDEDGGFEPDDYRNEYDEWDSPPAEKDNALSRFLSWCQKRLRGADDEDDESLNEIIDNARARVEHYHESGQNEQHRERLSDPDYRGSLAYTFSEQTENLESLLDRYDRLCDSGGNFIEQELYEQRVATLAEALGDGEAKIQAYVQKRESLEQKWRQGRMSRHEYVDSLSEINFREQRLKTRIEMGGLGVTYDDLGDVSDEAEHIIDDSLASDGGAIRQQISRQIRSMTRDQAMAVIENAVAEGVIPQETADYLIREYVRAR